MEGDGQGLAWLVVALWFVQPLLLFLLVQIFDRAVSWESAKKRVHPPF